MGRNLVALSTPKYPSQLTMIAQNRKPTALDRR